MNIRYTNVTSRFSMDPDYVPYSQYQRLAELHDNQKKIISKLQEENQNLKLKLQELEEQQQQQKQ